MFYSVRTFGVLDSLGITELFFGVLIGLIGLILGAVVGIIKRFKQRGEKADDGSATKRRQVIVLSLLCLTSPASIHSVLRPTTKYTLSNRK
ncbi:MAG: hypothetical protein AUF79_18340 [Crenarchaeota archaeon 13_1_20CM_2_51_8]|nr:MAG: hypothetical protein AUF79_18340 [Crenarchaeota archaeon 13_1_20CM_2_51_8]